ncbi:WbqC-like protein [Aneurinibacillus soli]|uniref:WbqC-like protein family protein n=1 Tax=Aneurinibacillus soli TaxID=1500254 RepID=A0A0U5BEE2_9BACL|nr:WbqC family protein [Aneurinibacillus soli]PYE61535.1 WbqC-like protein [Aneurinibacillus soli]BAU26510.1 WbqC-like protein family protein [Aneurinibacillus soli]
MKRVAIIQSNYIPWKGYFDLINKVDEVILYDSVQYTRRDWRNRNQIQTANGPTWLSIPVLVKGKYFQKINETKICDSRWAEKHWKSIYYNYSNACFFEKTNSQFFEFYQVAKNFSHLSEINHFFIKNICEILNIKTKISFSMDYDLVGGKSERLLNLCLQTKATTYLSGPAAKSYLDESLFQSNGINIEWMDYNGYPLYKQIHSQPFVHALSIIDLLFNVGVENAPKYMLSF